jgi:diguanylate cyclase
MQEQRDIALKDPLTGVFNRLAFEERIEEEFQRWNRYGNPLSLLVLDIDHFKQVNDTFGHLAGDKALKAVALRLLQNVREVDIVARYGGEEFVVIMPNTDSEAAYRVAEKLRSVIAGAGFHYRNQPVRITVSCGLAGFREGDTAEDAFRRADDALYGAKQAGRNRTHREDEAAADGP